MGINQDAAKVFTLDLGIAKKYNQSFFNRHHSHAGNPKYASLNSHNEYGKAILLIFRLRHKNKINPFVIFFFRFIKT